MWFGTGAEKDDKGRAPEPRIGLITYRIHTQLLVLLVPMNIVKVGNKYNVKLETDSHKDQLF